MKIDTGKTLLPVEASDFKKTCLYIQTMKNLKLNDTIMMDFCPVVKYNDADLEKVQILADNRKKVGVYLWINNENGNKYVGSSVSLSVRMYTGLLKKKIKSWQSCQTTKF